MEVINASGYTYCNLKNKYGTINNEQYFCIAKCLSNDSQILTENGIKKLRDIEINQTFNILSLNLNKQILEKDIAKKVDSGVKKIFEIKTNSGKKIKASEDHVFFVALHNKIIQKTLKELKRGDKILCL